MTNNRDFIVSGSVFGEFKTSINLDLTESNERDSKSGYK